MTEEDTSQTDLDSHADTCVVGANSLVTHDYERPVKVTGYDATDGYKTCKTVTATLAYDDPSDGTPIILEVQQAIHIPRLQHNLLCPMQLRLNDVGVNEVPKFLTKDPTDETHAIVLPPTDAGEEKYLIPLSLDGVTSYFPTRKPTRDEYENAERRYQLTYGAPEWNPASSTFQDQEEEMTDHKGRVRDYTLRRPAVICSISSDIEQYEPNLAATKMPWKAGPTSSKQFDGGPISSGMPDGRTTSAVQTRKAPPIDPSTLARRWGVGIEAARNTLRHTTQRGVRSILNPTLTRRFRTNDRQMRYRCLPMTLFADTLISNTRSRRGNLYAEVFTCRNGWKRAYPMQKKSQAHEALSLLFAREGVPVTMIVDGSKEQNLGQFKKKACEADCHIRTTEPHTPQSNAAEGAIRELKKAVGRKMVKSKCPKRLWDDCLELEAMIQSNTCSDVFELGGEVPETMVSGETSDISPFCQHAWYEWIKFRDTGPNFPDDKELLGRYLGPSIDVGPAMTAKILKANGQVLH